MESHFSPVGEHIGIVLKNQYPTQQCLWIFDHILGKISAKIARCIQHELHRLHPGSIVQYHVETRKDWYVLNSVQFLHMPQELATHHLPFFQGMLQLCFSCLPKSCMAQELFDFMHYTYCQSTLTRTQQILCLFRFFDLVGIYEEPVPATTSYLSQVPLADFLQEKLDDRCQRMIESWIVRCIAVYPNKQIEALIRTINVVSL